MIFFNFATSPISHGSWFRIFHVFLTIGPVQEGEWSNSDGPTIPKPRKHFWQGVFFDRLYLTVGVLKFAGVIL